MKKLLQSIQILGFSLGIRYWRLEKACRRDEKLVSKIIESCEQESKRCADCGDQDGAYLFASWADDIAESYGRYAAKKITV